MPTLLHTRVISWSRTNPTAYKSGQLDKVTPRQPYRIQEWSVGEEPTLLCTRAVSWSRLHHANPTAYKSG